MHDRSVRVLFICSGNICRSPTAEGVFLRLVERAGLTDRVEIDSAGTGGWHAGDPPDARSQVAAARRGIDLSGLRARQLGPGDCRHFDLLIVMDAANEAAVRRLCGPERVRRLLAFSPGAAFHDVPDPYYGGPDGFERVLDLIEAACEGLLAHLRGSYLSA